MHETRNPGGIIAASVLASVLSVTALWFVHGAVIAPPPAFAQRPTAPDVVLYAMPRGADGKDESFIFYNAVTGDIWVYRDEKIRDHYRLTTLGEDMQKD